MKRCAKCKDEMLIKDAKPSLKTNGLVCEVCHQAEKDFIHYEANPAWIPPVRQVKPRLSTYVYQ